ncbi:hypothetical protein KO984_004098, partial [Escherichia coli]|nr:hypothetical protein [Escherichia coli]
MSTITKEFTKEQLIEHLRTRIEHRKGLIASMHIDRGYRDYLKLELRSSEIALASLEAEAVCYLTWHQGFRAPDDCEEYVVEAKPGDKSCDGSPAFPVYTAPTAPASVPDELAGKSFEYIANKFQVSISEAQWILVGWNACRVAMLQGADGNSPVIPDGWVAVPVEPTIAILDEFDSIIDYGAEDSKDAWSRLLAAA